MKSQVQLLTGMIREFGLPVGCYSERDIATVVRRYACEGDAFLTIALPRLDDLLIAGLRDGRLPAFTGWSTKAGWSHPSFLHGFWKCIFQPDGSLSPNPSVHAIRAIRQISRTFKKVFEVCADDRVEEAISGFKAVDEELDKLSSPAWLDALSEVAHLLFGGVVGSALSAPRVFKHGPGAVAERYDSVKRWEFPVVSPRIAELVGVEAFRPTWESLESDPPVLAEIPARLIAVPKTAEKPRLISIEPSYNQFVQQSLAEHLKTGLSRLSICDITDQSRNKRLAHLGSIDGSLATVDLSEASDRVHYGFLRETFRWNPSFLEYLDLSRSVTIQTPSGELVHLNKFASMGSALTFPLETMFFVAIVVYTICEVERDFSRSHVRFNLTREDLGVYGDDIILPSKYYPTLLRRLAEIGLKVNTNKSFSVGGFRESCGGDYWKGHDVTPIYVRRNIPSSARDVSGLVSLSSFRNQWVARYWYGPVQEFLDKTISAIIPYPAAHQGAHIVDWEKPFDGGGICRVGPLDIPIFRWSSRLHRCEVRMMVPVGTRKRTTSSTRGVLFKALYGGYNRDIHHLTHHGRPISAKLKYRWLGRG